MNEKKLSIYTAEQPMSRTNGDEYEQWYHAFLILMDETNGEGVGGQVIEQLNFINQDGFQLVPKIRIGINDPSKLLKMHLSRVASGDERDIMDRWNKGLSFALDVRAAKIYFGEDFSSSANAVNCRTGVKGAVEAMGLTYRHEFAKSVAGTDVEISPKPSHGLLVAGRSFAYNHEILLHALMHAEM